jgi:hypothetical protein
MLGLFALKWLPLARAGMSLLSGAATRAIPTFLGWGQALIASARAGRLHAVMTMDVGAAVRSLAGATWGGVRAAVAWTAATVRDIAVKTAHAASVVAGTVATWASTAASRAAAAAQWLWNAAMAANPIGLIITGVTALVAGGVLLGRNWHQVTAAVRGAFDWFKNLLGKAPDWLLALVFPLGLIVKHLGTVKTVPTAVFVALRSAVSSTAGWIKGMAGALFAPVIGATRAVINWVASAWGALQEILLAPISAIQAGWAGLGHALAGVFTRAADTVTGAFTAVRDAIMGALNWLWDKLTWVIARIPSVFLPEGLEAITRTRPANEAGLPVGGQMVVPATAPAASRATPRPTVPREAMALPTFAAATAGGPVDQSIVIQAGAIQIHAVRVDEEVVRRIDFELAKLIRRRQERR